LLDHTYSLLNRLARSTERVLELATKTLEEVPIVFYDQRLANRATFSRYGHMGEYRTPERQSAGLYPFEQRMLERYFPQAPARILVHGAGGGRELLALAKVGYSVQAHEPSAALAKAAQGLVQSRDGVSVRGQSVQEWAKEASGHFDGVFTGWAMWAHLVQKQERLDVLRAFRRVCPGGPVLLSFFRADQCFSISEQRSQPGPLHPGWQSRLLHLTRHSIREKLLRLPPIERGTGWHDGHFYHLTEEWELREEAAEAGYEVAYWEKDALIYPHAVLLPAP
jgi:2-polyprenyl-3-methyl-5-hydroxy-6-metoxy-1,4-benzoquinol methylase